MQRLFLFLVLFCFSGSLSAQQMQECDSVRTKQRINDIYKKLGAGTSFDDLVKTYNEDPGMGTGTNGTYEGKIDIFEVHYQAMFKKLKPGEISKPFRNDFGYSIVKLVYLKNGTVKFKHLLLSCPK